jgi:hypothetical protein
METYFAPAERDNIERVTCQAKSICHSPVINTLLQNTSDLLLVINSKRQIVAFNKAVTDSLGIAEPELALGLRFGEVLRCKYSFDEPNGCGTTPYCSTCGAVIATMAAIDDNTPCERICALTTDKKRKSSDSCLRVRSQPVVVDGDRWILVYAQDVSDQRHWENLENEFLQDLENKLYFVKNYSSYVHDQIPTDGALSKLTLTIGRVAREVKLQNALRNHRHIDSLAITENVSLKSIRNMVFDTILNKSVMTGKTVIEEGTDLDCAVHTDPILVSRVIIKMLLNALEATELGGTVRFKATVYETKVTWIVWNNGFIPENIQLRLFHKYYSTKTGKGRGFGTYRMKLLGEKYLGGKVSFKSKAEEGTTFSLSLPL